MSENSKDQPNDGFGVWAILELMGHVKIAGYVTEEERFGTVMGRIDIPTNDEAMMTQYFGGSAVYRLTPVTETVARAFAARNQPRPVYVYELALPERSGSGEEPLWAGGGGPGVSHGRGPDDFDDDFDDLEL